MKVDLLLGILLLYSKQTTIELTSFYIGHQQIRPIKSSTTDFIIHY